MGNAWTLKFDVSSCSFLPLTSYYASQKKTFEINPRHPLIKDMLRRVKVSNIAALLLWLSVGILRTF